MPEPGAILQVANLVRRLHGVNAEQFVLAEIWRREDWGTRPHVAEAWREVLEVLEQPGSFETSRFATLAGRNRRGRRVAV